MDIDGEHADLQDDLRFIAANGVQDGDAVTRLQRLADASRASLSIRHALGEQRILDQLITTLNRRDSSAAVLPTLDTQILRCVGNACASNPSGVVVVANNEFNWLHFFLSTDAPAELRSLATKVLYNVCAADFEGDDECGEKENPAPSKLYRDDFHPDIINVLCSLQPDHPDVELLVDALFWVSSAATSTSEQPVHQALWRILDIEWFEGFVRQADAEVLASLVESIVSLCRPANVREALLAQGRLLDLIKILASLDTRLTTAEKADGDTHLDDTALLVPQASALIWLLSDISADATFAQVERLTTPPMQAVAEALQRSDVSDRMLTAACIVLGNGLLNLPDDDIASVVRDSSVPTCILTAVLKPEASPDLLHAAASLLIVLCKPSPVVREAIAKLDPAQSAVERLCTHSAPQVRDAGIKALRALGRESESVQRQFASLAANLQPVDPSQNAGGG